MVMKRKRNMSIDTNGRFGQALYRYQVKGDRRLIIAIRDMVLHCDMSDHYATSKSGDYYLKSGLPTVYYLVNYIKGVVNQILRQCRSREKGGYERFKRLKRYEKRICEVMKVDNVENVCRKDIKTLLTADALKDYDELIEREAEYHDRVRQDEDKIIETLVPQIEIALEYAFSHVERSRSKHEIVTYLIRTFRGQFWRQRIEESAVKRVMSKGDAEISDEDYSKSYYEKARRVYVLPRFSTTEEYTLELIGCEDVGQMPNTLNKNQELLINRILELYEYDMKLNRIDKYRLTLQGKPKPNFRYISSELGMEESNLKHKIYRIRRKIAKQNVTL